MRKRYTSRIGLALVSLATFLVLWRGVVWLGDYPPFILPPPRAVVERLGDLLADGSLWFHAGVTLREVLAGLGLGTLVATLLGYVLAHSPLAEQLLAPYIVASQSVPTVAIAPLLVIWFGTGLLSKILVCALIVFFPILVWKFGIISRNCGHDIFPPEFFLIQQAFFQQQSPLLIGYLCQERKKIGRGFFSGKTAVPISIKIKSFSLVPKVIIDQIFHLVVFF